MLRKPEANPGIPARDHTGQISPADNLDRVHVSTDGVEQGRHEIRVVQAVLDQILPQVIVLLLHAKVDGLPHAHHTARVRVSFKIKVSGLGC
jgi:hypothetical protein